LGLDIITILPQQVGGVTGIKVASLAMFVNLARGNSLLEGCEQFDVFTEWNTSTTSDLIWKPQIVSSSGG
jgi:hypothetical protein